MRHRSRHPEHTCLCKSYSLGTRARSCMTLSKFNINKLLRGTGAQQQLRAIRATTSTPGRIRKQSCLHAWTFSWMGLRAAPDGDSAWCHTLRRTTTLARSRCTIPCKGDSSVSDLFLVHNPMHMYPVLSRLKRRKNQVPCPGCREHQRMSVRGYQRRVRLAMEPVRAASEATHTDPYKCRWRGVAECALVVFQRTRGRFNPAACSRMLSHSAQQEIRKTRMHCTV